MAAAYVRHGFRAIKLQMWRDDPDQDVEVVRLIRPAGIGRDQLEIMIDRTGAMSGQCWTYETALRVARSLEALDATHHDGVPPPGEWCDHDPNRTGSGSATERRRRRGVPAMVRAR